MSNSVRGLAGGIVGGIIGFAVAGPLGASVGWSIAIGATMGFAVGMGSQLSADMRGQPALTSGVDPVRADSPNAGAPQSSKFEVNTCEEGLILYDLLGTSKITGNILHYENNRTSAIKETRQVYAGTRPVVTSSGSSGGGKGGGGSSSQTATTVVHEPVYQTEEVIVGYAYYLTWAVGICLGPVTTLYSVFRGDECVWAGAATDSGAGYTDISISGMGTMRFYFGTSNQPVTTYGPRRLCYAVFTDCYLGAYNRCPTMRFVVGKRPVFSFNEKETINTYEYNPAHAIWYILTTLLGLPESYLDETAFSDAADTLYSENFGVNVLFNQQQSAMTYIEGILRHIDAVMTYRS